MKRLSRYFIKKTHEKALYEAKNVKEPCSFWETFIIFAKDREL